VASLFSAVLQADISDEQYNNLVEELRAEYSQQTEGVLPEFEYEANILLDGLVRKVASVIEQDGNYQKYINMRKAIAKRPEWEEAASYTASLINFDMSLPDTEKSLMKDSEFADMVRTLAIWHDLFLNNLVPVLKVFNKDINKYMPPPEDF
jgi:hypothetical protein